MRFDLEAMRASPGRLFRISGTELIEQFEWHGETLYPEGPVDAEAVAFSQQDQVVLRLNIKARVHRRCSRCLSDLMDVAEYEGVLEVFPSDLEGRYLELRPFIEAGLRLGLSQKPLCRSDCRGICPDCGADLNREEHRAGCVRQRKGDPRLQKLKELL